jgi:hypothetical protein
MGHCHCARHHVAFWKSWDVQITLTEGGLNVQCIESYDQRGTVAPTFTVRVTVVGGVYRYSTLHAEPITVRVTGEGGVVQYLAC